MSRSLIAADNLKASSPAETGRFYEFSPEIVEKWFGGKELRLGRFGVQGDGSCFWHSVCVALNLEDYVHQSEDVQRQIAYKLRCSQSSKLDAGLLKSIAKKVSNGKSPKSRAELHEALCDPKVWADETAIRLFSETSGINIIFLDMNKNEMYCGVHHEDALTKKLPKTMVVLWMNHAHFEPMALLVKHGKLTSELRVLFDPEKYDEDKAIIKALMTSYATSCNIRKKF